MVGEKRRDIVGLPFVALVGMTCLSIIFNACFFPLTLMPEAVEGSYRLFNQAVCLAGALVALVAIPVLAKGKPWHLDIVGIAGYVLLALGLCTASSAVPGESQAWALASGVGCGAGLTLACAMWVGMLGCFSERIAVLVLGWQALVGSVGFACIGFTVETLTNEVSLALCVISAMLFVVVGQRLPQLREGPAPFAASGSARCASTVKSDGDVNASLLASGSGRCASGATRDGGVNVPDSASVPARGSSAASAGMRGRFAEMGPLAALAVGFFLLVFIFGAIEAVALGYDGSPHGVAVSYLGAPLGSLIFLAMMYLGKKRDYATVMKAIFLVLLVVFWIPVFDAVVLVLSTCFHLGLLLMGSLLVDECAVRCRRLMAFAAIGFGAMRLLYLAGLYCPGLFGVPSYSYYASSSLLMFLVYAAFIVSVWYEHIRRTSSAAASNNLSCVDVDEGDVPCAPTVEPQACQLVAESVALDGALTSLACFYGLTKRETEILGLYARGRDINFVCQALDLSRNTVKGHAKNLYVKMGVHSKQELIDCVETELKRAGSASV